MFTKALAETVPVPVEVANPAGILKPGHRVVPVRPPSRAPRGGRTASA
jgi:hypothetical protein